MNEKLLQIQSSAKNMQESSPMQFKFGLKSQDDLDMLSNLDESSNPIKPSTNALKFLNSEKFLKSITACFANGNKRVCKKLKKNMEDLRSNRKLMKKVFKEVISGIIKKNNMSRNPQFQFLNKAKVLKASNQDLITSILNLPVDSSKLNQNDSNKLNNGFKKLFKVLKTRVDCLSEPNSSDCKVMKKKSLKRRLIKKAISNMISRIEI